MGKKKTDQIEKRAAYAARRRAHQAALVAREKADADREAAIRRAFTARPVDAAAWLPKEQRAVLAARAPRLLEARHHPALRRLLEQPRLRTLETWSPRGKSADALFRSLGDHLLAAYPVPAIVWRAFDDANAALFAPLATFIAGGGSAFAWAQTHALPIALTRRMVHDLLSTPADVGFTDALRRAQVRAAGGDRGLFDAVRASRFGRVVGTTEEEAFWASVIAWAARQPMLDPRRLPPLFDYLEAQRRETPGFSMKGRSAAALLRATDAWHGDLARVKNTRHTVFPSAGFTPGEYEDFRRELGVVVKEIWRIREILDTEALADEGKRMGHCVYSYAWRIEKGESSIWSLQMEDGRGETGRWHMATVEVRNDLRKVVQARGRFNRAMTPKETRMVTRWANANGLAMGIGTW